MHDGMFLLKPQPVINTWLADACCASAHITISCLVHPMMDIESNYFEVKKNNQEKKTLEDLVICKRNCNKDSKVNDIDI